MKGILSVILVSLLISISECEVSERAKKLAESLIKIQKFRDSFKARKLQTDDSSSQGEEVIPNKNKNANLQFLAINGYTPKASSIEGHKAFTFNIFFYFLNMVIPQKVFVPMKLTLGRLRALADTSIESTCTPTGSATDKDTAGGQSQKFECTGDVETTSDIKGLSISANDPIKTQGSDGKNSTVSTDDINFSEDASKAASNIENAKEQIDQVVVLQNGEIGTKNKGQFAINGNLVDTVKDGDTVVLDLHDDKTNSDKKIPCSVTRNSGDAVSLNCDTNEENISADLDSKSGMDGTTKVFLNMKSGNERIEITDANSTTNSNAVYRKNSSGLSGGAIAGIVIACVVVLIAASVAALMLRKPTVAPPVDNTTAVQLRTVDNI
jgi:hypothetical protein